MALLQRDRKPLKGPATPPVVMDRLTRGREAMRKDSAYRRLAYKFWTNDHYWYVSAKGLLTSQGTVTAANGSGKPPHRIRNRYPFITMLVEAKVSAATQRVPGYEVTPSTGDRMDEEAAIQAGQVAAYLYDQIGVRRATTKVVTNALVKREGFAFPYFDPNVGPYRQQINLETGDVENVGRGEIKILTLSRDEVMWEPGVDFQDSRWHAIERAVPLYEVQEIPGFFGGSLVGDATTADTPTERQRENMVLLTDYLERPCPKYPKGRRMRFANGRMICPEENYPALSVSGEVADEPVLHRLSYTVNPEGDDQGLVERLIDLQRTVNDCWNKLLEWKNRCLNPQMMAPFGTFPKGFQRNDIPGYTNFYQPTSGGPPTWETPPPVPRELFDMLNQAIQHMRALAADIDVQAAPDVAAKSMQAAVEQGQQRWQSFIGDLAEFHSRLMRACLTLVQVYYDEPRQIELQGDYAPYTLQNFTGQDLRSQVNVRVQPGSLVAQSRSAIAEEVQMIQTLWPGAVTPEAGIAALHGGVGSNMIKSYQNHVSRAWRMVNLCRQGVEALSAIPRRFDPDVQRTNENGEPLFTPKLDMAGNALVNLETGEPLLDPVMGDDVPGWMPRKQDNIDIWMQVFGDAMTTPWFERLDPDQQHVFDLVWDALEKLKTQRVQKDLMDRQEMAAGQGLDNAAKPQAAPPLPDRSDVAPR